MQDLLGWIEGVNGEGLAAHLIGLEQILLLFGA